MNPLTFFIIPPIYKVVNRIFVFFNVTIDESSKMKLATLEYKKHLDEVYL